MMRSFHMSAPVFVLLVVSAAGTSTAEGLIRLAELPVEFAEEWPAGGVVPAAATIDAGQIEPAAADPSAPSGPCYADAYSSCDEGCCFDFNICQLPCRYAQVDGLFWHRVGAGCNQIVVIDTDDNNPLFRTGDLNFDLTPGARFLYGWQPGGACAKCCAWEVSYFGLYGWNSDGIVFGAGDLAIPGDLGLASNNFFGADIIGVDYTSNLHNVELNCVKTCCLDCATRLDFLCGFRYLNLNEQFVLTGTDLQEGTSSYTIDADNHLFGVQLGGRLSRAWCRWAVELTGKAGIFYNAASQHQIVTDFPNNPNPFVLRDATGSGGSVAMLGEIGVAFVRPINDCWNFRIGYSAIGLGGVALAPDQLDFTDTVTSGTDLHTGGWIFAHGGLVGVERRW